MQSWQVWRNSAHATAQGGNALCGVVCGPVKGDQIFRLIRRGALRGFGRWSPVFQRQKQVRRSCDNWRGANSFLPRYDHPCPDRGELVRAVIDFGSDDFEPFNAFQKGFAEKYVVISCAPLWRSRYLQRWCACAWSRFARHGYGKSGRCGIALLYATQYRKRMEWWFGCSASTRRRANQAEWARNDSAVSQALKDGQNDRAPQKVFCPYNHAGQPFYVIAKQARSTVLVKNAPVLGETAGQLNIMADPQFQRGERFARISDRPGKHGQRMGVVAVGLDCFRDAMLVSGN